jgi:hypothetical protein
MQSLVLDCHVSTHSRAALENLAKSDWRSAEFCGLSVGGAERTARSNTIRVSSGNCEFEIGAMSMDIAPKWEVFVLYAETLEATGEHNNARSSRVGRRASADEMLEAFSKAITHCFYQ